ncbi:hypothetical protein D3C72_1998840 [compost metagenome]
MARTVPKDRSISLSWVISPAGVMIALSVPDVPTALLMPISLMVSAASLRSTAICREPLAMGWATKRTRPDRNSEASNPILARPATSMVEDRRKVGSVVGVPASSISAGRPSISAEPPSW